MTGDRIWSRYHLHNPDCTIAYHIAGAGKGCAAWVAVLREADARKTWQKMLPGYVARAVGGQKREPSVRELAHAVVNVALINPNRTQRYTGLPLLTVYLRREDGSWYDIAVKDHAVHRIAPIQSRRLLAACEGKFLNSLT